VSARRPEDDRDVIPRWRNPRNTAAGGELAPLRTGAGKTVDQTGRLEREQDWLTHKSIGFALDLVGTAVVLGVSPPARDAAELVLETAELSGLAHGLARQVLGEAGSGESEIPKSDPTTHEVRTQIKQFRAKLKNDPRNGLAWTEMARHYTILGQRDQASHAMRIALGLLPGHRYVLRAAARLAVHHGKFEDAHSMIARAPGTSSDPWLVAAELATAGPADVRPKMIKHGRRMLEEGGFSRRSTSELASALGTLEFRAGADRKARHLIETSLEAPNDNSIAQGEWISRGLPSLDVDPSLMSESAEARAIRHATAMESEQVLPAAWEWHRDQSFASGPGELGSYHASLVGMYAEGAAIAEAARTANSGEFLLANNLAFCLLNMNDVGRASEVLGSIDRNALDERQLSTYLATCGLLEFRSGNAEGGRALYRQSIKLDRDPHHRTVAMIMLASEEVRLHSANADRLVEEARAAGMKFEAEDIKLWLNRLTKGT
jgi:tetratricopeptide (TPR) repeat protein